MVVLSRFLSSNDDALSIGSIQRLGGVVASNNPSYSLRRKCSLRTGNKSSKVTKARSPAAFTLC